MVAVAIARIPLKPGNQHVGSISPDHPDHVAQSNVMAAPFIECLVRGLGKPEISNSREALGYAVVVISGQQLESAEHAERVKQFAPGLVLSALAAVQRQEQDACALAPGLERQHPAVLVV